MQIQTHKRALYILGLVVVVLIVGQWVTRANRTVTSRPLGDPIARIYESDPARKMIGTTVEDIAFDDLVSRRKVQLAELQDKVVVIESFSVGCPACAEGIKKYNALYDRYAPKMQIVYLNINPADTALDIFDIKVNYEGRDWIWVKHSPELAPFLSRYKLNENDMTYILKNNQIVYADSLNAPAERIEGAIREALEL